MKKKWFSLFLFFGIVWVSSFLLFFKFMNKENKISRKNKILVPINYVDGDKPSLIWKNRRKININISSITGDKEILNCVKIFVWNIRYHISWEEVFDMEVNNVCKKELIMIDSLWKKIEIFPYGTERFPFTKIRDSKIWFTGRQLCFHPLLIFYFKDNPNKKVYINFTWSDVCTNEEFSLQKIDDIYWKSKKYLFYKWKKINWVDPNKAEIIELSWISKDWKIEKLDEKVVKYNWKIFIQWWKYILDEKNLKKIWNYLLDNRTLLWLDFYSWGTKTVICRIWWAYYSDKNYNLVKKFKVFNDKYATDGKVILYKWKKILDSDPSTFVIIKDWVAKDKWNRYEWGEKKGYHLSWWKEYYDSKLIKDVDLQTFQVLNKYYAKDKERVYFKGQPVYNADSKSFKVIEWVYWKDKNYVFLEWGPIFWADSKTFKILWWWYAKDRNKIYYSRTPVKWADIRSFEVLTWDKCKNEKDLVYMWEDWIPVIEWDFFERLMWNKKIKYTYYGKDKNNVYFQWQIIKGADPATFIIICVPWAKDKKYVYRDNKIFSGADPKTFKVLWWWYVKDKSKVWWNMYLITGADSKSFEYLWWWYAKDRNKVYYIWDEIRWVDVQTFKVTNPKKALAEDNNCIYEKGRCIRKKRVNSNIINFYEKDDSFDDVELRKPVIYLYPTKKQLVEVKLYLSWQMIASYPDYNSGINWWKVMAYPSWKLIWSGRKYDYLFREWNIKYNFSFKEWFVVRWEEIKSFFEKILPQLWLTGSEVNEFIVYWYPKMKSSRYNLVYFLTEEEIERIAKLEVNPKPDSVLRVFMIRKPIDRKVDIRPQKIKTFERKWFVVVEWWGAEVR